MKILCMHLKIFLCLTAAAILLGIVTELLNVSTRTLQRMRDDHRIEYVIVRGTCRYRLSEVQRLLETNTVRNKEKTIDALFHNYSLRTGGRKTGKGRRK